MNKNAVIKTLDGVRKFEIVGQRNADVSGVFEFYSLLLNALMYTPIVNGMTDLPDIRPQMATYLKNGQQDVHPKFVALAQNQDAAVNVSPYFAVNLIPNIPKSSLNIVLDAVLAIVVGDTALGKTTHAKFKSWRKDKSEADFLAEAFILAVRARKNKVDMSVEFAAEITGVLDDVEAMKAKLTTLPKLETITPPTTPEEHERSYIAALLDAYDDANESGKPPSEDLSLYPKYDKDLRNRRIEYFAAEALHRGTRENFRNNDPENLFAALMSETHDGVLDIHAMNYKHGFDRLLNVMAHASNLTLSSLLYHIPGWVGPRQKKGVCHMLVNTGQIEGWVDNDE